MFQIYRLRKKITCVHKVGICQMRENMFGQNYLYSYIIETCVPEVRNDRVFGIGEI